MRLEISKVTDSAGHHLFYHELLTTALKEIGHTPILTVSNTPHLRSKQYLDSGITSIFWMLETKERNQRYIPIEVGLTDGLIGKRILLIKKGEQSHYDKVKNLDDFRGLNLTAAMGLKWFDAKVWRANHLKYKEFIGNWASLFKMLEKDRGFDYFARGVNEIISEAKLHSGLAIEQKLLLIYERDFRFYLSKTGPNAGAQYKDIIASAMIKAKESGLITRLVNKYWGNDIKSLHYDERIKIYLDSPSSDD